MHREIKPYFLDLVLDIQFSDSFYYVLLWNNIKDPDFEYIRRLGGRGAIYTKKKNI